MSIPIPLTVRMVTNQADRHVTRDLRDLSFRETAVGGWASAKFSFNRPLSLQPNELAYFSKVYVYDRRSGRTVWEGRLEDPGRSVGSDGQVWSLTAMGPAAHAQDIEVPLIYVDRDLQSWIPVDTTVDSGGDAKAITVDAASLPVDPTFRMQWPNGSDLVTNSRVVQAYPLLRASGQRMARYDYSWSAGRTNSNLRIQSVTRDTGGGANGRDDAFNTGGGGGAAKLITTDFANTRDWLELRILWNGGTQSIGDDVTWAGFIRPYVMATRYNQSGTEQLLGSAYTAGTVLASEVVADLLGRLLSAYDGANSTIATTAFAIDQLAYPSAVTAARVFDDLMTFEPGYRWGAYESTASSAGRYRFEWTAWPSTVRYEADAGDGFEAPAEGDGLYNAVRVRWRDVAGQVQTTRRTSSVPELTAAGLTREGFVDLGSQVGSEANAVQVGDQFLAEHGTPPNGGRLTVARPIRDLSTGRLRQPWEIKAGELIRVRGVLPRVDSLNASTRDGATVMRVWSKEYTVGTGAATLELDSYSRSTARALANLQTDQLSRRR